MYSELVQSFHLPGGVDNVRGPAGHKHGRVHDRHLHRRHLALGRQLRQVTSFFLKQSGGSGEGGWLQRLTWKAVLHSSLKVNV